MYGRRVYGGQAVRTCTTSFAPRATPWYIPAAVRWPPVIQPAPAPPPDAAGAAKPDGARGGGREPAATPAQKVPWPVELSEASPHGAAAV